MNDTHTPEVRQASYSENKEQKNYLESASPPHPALYIIR